jgi:hypothetical protein
MSKAQLDLRGTDKFAGNQYSYKHGEIRSGKQRKLGIQQLLRMQSLYYHAVSTIMATYSVKIIFKFWSAPNKDEIREVLAEEHLLLPCEYVSIITKFAQ